MYTMEGYLDDPSSGPPAGPPRGTDRCGEPRDAATHVRPTRQHAARNGAQARIDTRKQGPWNDVSTKRNVQLHFSESETSNVVHTRARTQPHAHASSQHAYANVSHMSMRPQAV